ncbi:hypothetical protein PR048_029188 [Dryococelus australis]|uniref:Uncharacterized protein n=1 Tax=Dryococelus australis TaxID=614101 RepID=A0ABQ9GCN6_9NEOP|nr:hypothetical protein PR048_029188 [Dryococelus australis]
MEQRRNEGAGEMGDPREREYSPTSCIVRDDSHLRKSWGDPVGNRALGGRRDTTRDVRNFIDCPSKRPPCATNCRVATGLENREISGDLKTVTEIKEIQLRPPNPKIICSNEDKYTTHKARTKADWVLLPAAAIRILVCGKRGGRCLWPVDVLGAFPFPPLLHSAIAPTSSHFSVIGAQDSIIPPPKQWLELTGKRTCYSTCGTSQQAEDGGGKREHLEKTHLSQAASVGRSGSYCVAGLTPYAYQERKSFKETCITAERDWVDMASDWGHDHLPECTYSLTITKKRLGKTVKDNDSSSEAGFSWGDARNTLVVREVMLWDHSRRFPSKPETKRNGSELPKRWRRPVERERKELASLRDLMLTYVAGMSTGRRGNVWQLAAEEDRRRARLSETTVDTRVRECCGGGGIRRRLLCTERSGRSRTFWTEVIFGLELGGTDWTSYVSVIAASACSLPRARPKTGVNDTEQLLRLARGRLKCSRGCSVAHRREICGFSGVPAPTCPSRLLQFYRPFTVTYYLSEALLKSYFRGIPPPLVNKCLRGTMYLRVQGQEAREHFGRQIHARLAPHRSYAQGVQCSRSNSVLCKLDLQPVSLIASHQGERGSIPGGVTPGFSHVGIVPDYAAGRRIFSEVSRSPCCWFRLCCIPQSLSSLSRPRCSNHFTPRSLVRSQCNDI